MTPGELIASVIAAAGGVGVLFVGAGAWLIKQWSDRLATANEAHHARELELLKNNLDLSRTQQNRLSEAQFNLYVEVWNKLQEVKTAGDRLWEKASPDTLVAFRESLRAAYLAANRGRLILSEEHYTQLTELLRHFKDFEVGKAKLIETRDLHDVEQGFDILEIMNQVEENGQAKDSYDRLLGQIVAEFRKQLGIAA